MVRRFYVVHIVGPKVYCMLRAAKTVRYNHWRWLLTTNMFETKTTGID